MLWKDFKYKIKMLAIRLDISMNELESWKFADVIRALNLMGL